MSRITPHYHIKNEWSGQRTLEIYQSDGVFNLYLKKENLKWVPALLDRSTAVDQCYKLGIFQKKKKITCMFPSRQLKTLTAVLIFITVKLGVLILFHSNYLQTSFSLVFLLKGHFTQIPKEEKGFSHTSSGIWPCRLELLSIK